MEEVGGKPRDFALDHVHEEGPHEDLKAGLLLAVFLIEGFKTLLKTSSDLSLFEFAFFLSFDLFFEDFALSTALRHKVNLFRKLEMKRLTNMPKISYEDKKRIQKIDVKSGKIKGSEA